MLTGTPGGPRQCGRRTCPIPVSERNGKRLTRTVVSLVFFLIVKIVVWPWMSETLMLSVLAATVRGGQSRQKGRNVRVQSGFLALPLMLGLTSRGGEAAPGIVAVWWRLVGIGIQMRRRRDAEDEIEMTAKREKEGKHNPNEGRKTGRQEARQTRPGVQSRRIRRYGPSSYGPLGTPHTRLQWLASCLCVTKGTQRHSQAHPYIVTVAQPNISYAPILVPLLTKGSTVDGGGGGQVTRAY